MTGRDEKAGRLDTPGGGAARGLWRSQEGPGCAFRQRNAGEDARRGTQRIVGGPHKLGEKIDISEVIQTKPAVLQRIVGFNPDVALGLVEHARRRWECCSEVEANFMDGHTLPVKKVLNDEGQILTFHDLPVSSLNSRTTVALATSPGSTRPPGSDQIESPLPGGARDGRCLRRAPQHAG